MHKLSLLAAATCLVLGGCALNPASAPLARPPEAFAACSAKMRKAAETVQASSLPVVYRGAYSSGTRADCGDLGVTVAGLANATEVEQVLSAAGIKAKVDVIGPPKLQPAPPQAASPLVPSPKALTGHSGQRLEVEIPLLNAGAAGQLHWGEPDYDWELLNARGQAVAFRGATLFPMPLYGLDCATNALCTLEMTFLDLNRMNRKLPLPAGDYTLRVRLSDLEMHGQKLDLGVFDLPVTVLP